MTRIPEPCSWLPGFEPEPAAAFAPPMPPIPPDPPLDDEPGEEEHEPRPPQPLWRPSEPPTPSAARRPWPQLPAGGLDIPRGAVAKFEANLAAIETLRALDASGSEPDENQRSTLLRYTGWGGLPASFNLEAPEPAWSRRAAQLRDALDAEDHSSALASVNNSHYTPVAVIAAMWRAVQGFGFTGGRVLEPSAGIGHFLGAMPAALAEQCTVTAIEIDRLSGRMLRALYGASGVDVRIAAFEKTPLADAWYDLTIGNVPFGAYKVADSSNRPYGRFSIHNYFLGRALALLRPGGLACFITSSHTMDSWEDTVQRYLASQAVLLGAIRLPRGAFAEIASTDVQADILFLRKRVPGEADEQPWLGLSVVPESMRDPRCGERYLQVNQWYAAQPEFCIGRIRQESNGHEPVPTAVFEGDLAAELPRRVDLLPRGVYSAAAPEAMPAPRRATIAAGGIRPGSHHLHHGRVHRVEDGELVDIHERLNATQRARIAGLCSIRDHARALLDLQLADADDGRQRHERAMLNGSYDRYVARFGCLSNRANALAFRRDPDYPLLLSLEHYDEETETATKAALFSRRTLARIVEPEAAAEPEEALAASVQWRGRVDPAWMGQLLSAPPQAVLDALADRGLVFLDPADGQWRTADDYLSGEVKAKLRQALAAGPGAARNVTALERVQPEDLPPAAIEPRLGAVWIPAGDVEDFIRQVLEQKDCEVGYSSQAGAWSVRYPEWSARQNVKVTQEFGTSRLNAIELVQCALNVQVPTVRDPDSESDRMIVNPDETLAAREKLALIKERFAAWAFDEAERRERLCRT